MPVSARRKGVTPHSARGWRSRRRWNLALIGPNSHPRKVRRWFRALRIGPGSELGGWPSDFMQKAAARHIRLREKALRPSTSPHGGLVEHPAGKAGELLARINPFEALKRNVTQTR